MQKAKWSLSNLPSMLRMNLSTYRDLTAWPAPLEILFVCIPVRTYSRTPDTRSLRSCPSGKSTASPIFRRVSNAGARREVRIHGVIRATRQRASRDRFDRSTGARCNQTFMAGRRRPNTVTLFAGRRTRSPKPSHRFSVEERHARIRPRRRQHLKEGTVRRIVGIAVAGPIIHPPRIHGLTRPTTSGCHPPSAAHA